MSNYERSGEMHNIEPTLLNRTVAEQIDDYQMKIYELMKHAYPQMVGYTADCHECLTENGEQNIHTRFFMHRPEDEERRMRELKFRAWSEETKSFEYFDLYEGTECGLTNLQIWARNSSIEQYTGLKDKNGKEIYEGDIVEALIDGMWSIGSNTVNFGKAKWRLEVLYNDIRFMDVFRIIGSKNCPDRIYYLFDKELSDIEIIGNIHENPELIKEEE